MATESKAIKLYFSYNQIHETVRQAVPAILKSDFRPTLIISIGGGGFIPARILRTFLKKEVGKSIPIQAIGLTLYEHDDACDPLERGVRKTQWLTYQHASGSSHEAAVSLQGHTILIVDEVDDTRKTLAYAVDELLKDIEAEKAAWLEEQHKQHSSNGSSSAAVPPSTPSMLSPPDSPQGSPMHTAGDAACAGTTGTSSSSLQSAADAAAAAAAAGEWREPRIGVFVVHNKLKPKKADLPASIMQHTYFSGGDIEDHWVIYPWDAEEIWEHTDKAHSPDSATQALVRSPSPGLAAAAAAGAGAAGAGAGSEAAVATPMVC